jgi:hypothetical protein
MSEPHLLPRLGRTCPTAGGGAELGIRPAKPATPTITDDTLIKSTTRNLRGPSP